MSESKFTNGPWKTVDHDEYGVNVWNVAGNKCIAERCRADDANLIAAAPDMYAALNTIIHIGANSNTVNYIKNIARAAMSKAEGVK